MLPQQEADQDQDMLDDLDGMVEEENVEQAVGGQEQQEEQAVQGGGEFDGHGEELRHVEHVHEAAGESPAAAAASEEPKELTEEQKMLLEEMNTLKARAVCLRCSRRVDSRCYTGEDTRAGGGVQKEERRPRQEHLDFVASSAFDDI